MVPIATELATAYISLVPSFKGGTSKIENELAGVGDGAGKRAGGGFSSAFGKAASLAAPLIAGAVVLKQVKDVFAAASESRKIAALTEQVIKTTGGAAKLTADQVGDMAGALAKKTGVDDEVIQSGANLLLTFKNLKDEAGAGNDIFTQTTALANDMSVALGQDMSSSSIQLGKALNDPIKGVSALTKVGVSFTESQKDQIKALTESGDLLGAQKIILEEVGDQFGGAAEAAATPMDKLKVVVGDLQEKLGEKLLPVIDKVATWLGDHLPGILKTTGEAFSRLGGFLAPVVDFFKNAFDMGRLLFDMFASGEADSQGFAEILDNIFGNTGALITPLRTLYDLVSGVYNFVKDVAIPGILDAAKGLFSGFTGDDETGIFGGIGAAARTAYDFIKDTVIPGIQDAVGSFIDGIQGKGGEGSFFTDLGEGISAAFKLIKEDVLPFIQDKVIPAFQKVASFIGDHLKPILITLAALFAPGAALIAGFIFAYQKSELFRDIIAGVFRVVKAVVTTAIDVVIGILKGLWTVIDEVIIPAFNWLKNIVVDVVFPAIVAIIRTAWAIIEPILNLVKAFIENVLVPVFNLLKYIVVDLVFPLIVAIIKDAWAVIKPVFDALIGFFNDTLMPIFTALWNTVSAAFDGILAAITWVWALVQPIFQAVIDFVTKTLSPVWDTLVDAVTAAWDKVPGIINGALKLAGNIIANFVRTGADLAKSLGLKNIAEELNDFADAADKWGEETAKKKKSSNTDKGTGGIAVGGGLRRSAGGLIPGPNINRDVVPVMAMPGEFMIRKSAVARYGPRYFSALNAGQTPAMAGGGPRIDHLEVTTVANANADEVVQAINAKLGWAHTTRRDR